jgi:hypothetical protein
MDINNESKLVSRDIENPASKDIVLEDWGKRTRYSACL